MRKVGQEKENLTEDGRGFETGTVAEAEVFEEEGIFDDLKKFYLRDFARFMAKTHIASAIEGSMAGSCFKMQELDGPACSFLFPALSDTLWRFLLSLFFPHSKKKSTGKKCGVMPTVLLLDKNNSCSVSR